MKKRIVLSTLLLVFSMVTTQSNCRLFSRKRKKQPEQSKITQQDLKDKYIFISLELVASCDPILLAKKVSTLAKLLPSKFISNDVLAIERSASMESVYRGVSTFADKAQDITNEAYKKMWAKTFRIKKKSIKNNIIDSYINSIQHIAPHSNDVDKILTKLREKNIFINDTTLEQYEKIKEKISFLNDDNFIVSSIPNVEALISETAFFERVLKSLSLKAQDCLVLTSYQECANAAKSSGISTIVFKDHNEFISNMLKI